MSMKGSKAGELRAKLPAAKSPPASAEEQAKPPAERFDYRAAARAVVSSPAFVPGVLVFAGILLMFWRMIAFLPELWLSDDGYYSHGFLVPLISAFVIYKAWPRIKDRPVKPQYWAIVPLLGLSYCALVANVTGMQNIASFTLIFTLLFSVLFVAGWAWLKALTLPICYLLFGLPVWSMVIDTYTNPMQVLSTKVAFKILEIAGLQPIDLNANTIVLNNFTLDIGVPCSGLKLILALSAFTVFFVLIARLKALANVFMLFLILPLALLINGLRIALIGIVGNAYGAEAGHAFHDYSGYITLILCFFILFKIARGLGWKD
jgi:exosortase